MLNSPCVAYERPNENFDKAIAINIYQNVFKFTFYNCSKKKTSKRRCRHNLATSMDFRKIFSSLLLCLRVGDEAMSQRARKMLIQSLWG